MSMFCACHGKRNIGKFDERSDEAVFLGYSSHSKAYRVYNKKTMCVEEFVHIIFDETNFMTSEQETGDFKIGLANLDDENNTQKEQDQEEQQQVQNAETNQEQEQQADLEQPDVPNPEIPREVQEETIE